ncbi:MAG: hypothetical protein E7255_08450 [Lachnospiraceae bacterium]|nr:hypothetical protein [Lachnospiraceae bacterium]
MAYPKQFMSITELTETGLSRDFLKQLSRAEGAPIVRTLGGGKIYFKTSELNDFMEEISKKKPLRR